MTINLNIPIKLMIRFVRAIEQLAHDYRLVHSDVIERERLSKVVDKSVGRTYYQDDRAIYDEEQKEKVRRALEYGEEGTA